MGGDRNVIDKIKVPINEWHSSISKAEREDRCSESSEGARVGDVCCTHSAKTPKNSPAVVCTKICRERSF